MVINQISSSVGFIPLIRRDTTNEAWRNILYFLDGLLFRSNQNTPANLPNAILLALHDVEGVNGNAIRPYDPNFLDDLALVFFQLEELHIPRPVYRPIASLYHFDKVSGCSELRANRWGCIGEGGLLITALKGGHLAADDLLDLLLVPGGKGRLLGEGRLRNENQSHSKIE